MSLMFVAPSLIVGANEAVALARLGMRPSLVGVVGADEHARWLLERFGSDGVDTSGVREMTHYADGRTAFTGTAVQVVMGTLQSGDQVGDSLLYYPVTFPSCHFTL